jgi:hypothetical protein
VTEPVLSIAGGPPWLKIAEPSIRAAIVIAPVG